MMGRTAGTPTGISSASLAWSTPRDRRRPDGVEGPAFSDGLWDIVRIRQAPWYDPAINRLTDHGGEPSLEDDLRALLPGVG